MDFFNYIEIFKKYTKTIIFIFLFFVISSLILAYSLPKKFKATGVFSISAKYFQNPLIRGFLSETSDSTEMRAQKETLIMSAISDSFVDQLGFKYHLYSDKVQNNLHELYNERSFLRDRIEILPFSTAIQISFIAKDSDISHDVLKDIFDQIRYYLKQERKKYLGNLRNSIKKRIDILIASIDYSVDLKDINRSAAQNPIRLAEIIKLKTEISDKMKYFSPNHPEIKNLNKKLALLEGEIKKPDSDIAKNKTALKASKDLKDTKDLKEISENKELKDLKDPKDLKLNQDLSDSEDNSLSKNMGADFTLTKDDELPLSSSPNLLRAKNNIYEDLVVKYEYINIAMNNEDSDSSSYLSILSNPSYPLRPVSPNKVLILFWGAILGLLVCAFYVAIRENLFQKK